MSASKTEILNEVVNFLKEDLTGLRRAAEETHKSSTDDDSKQEGKYDTRGLEASYLAEAQAEQCALLEDNINHLQSIELVDQESDTPIHIGSLVIVANDDEEQGFFILPAGGGFETNLNGQEFTVISPDSPIAEAILGKCEGDFVDLTHLSGAFISEVW